MFKLEVTRTQVPVTRVRTADDRRREKLVRDLIAPACPVCSAAAGASCDWLAAVPDAVVRLSAEPLVMAHGVRLAVAVALRPRLRRVVLAQFGAGTVPAALAA